jgi:DNA-binding XRE family transcriptional regulator
MRKIKKIPRILKINWIEGLSISVVFNNGESRVIHMQEVLTDVYLCEDSPSSILLDPVEFSKVEIENYTLSWNNVEQYITGKDNKKIRVPFDIGPDTLYELSHPDKSQTPSRIGSLIKSTRKKMGLTQSELADRSGTSRTYISRIENDRSDVELGTLRKIIEIGLGKKMEIRIS